ncbi:MAG: class I SAM-dependent methyltransferase [Oscillospiraceae bacterium]|nr:class I SAM-dependent methyltransferase [Oscillospiraceae bacterium]
MTRKVKLCRAINAKFRIPPHPWNEATDGSMPFAQWQYERGEKTIQFYLDFTDAKSMFEGKTVVDIGCAAAGKTLYYAKLGVEKIYGVELLESFRAEAESLAAKLGLTDKFTFIQADAAALPFEDNSIDTIIMNDAMEHVDEPERVLAECLRVLKKGGRLFVNFPPYYHPYGAHLSDALGMPWIHLFFSEKTLIELYKDAVKDRPDAQDRIHFRTSERADGTAYFSYINKMTIRRFKKILKTTGLKPVYYREVPLRRPLKLFARLPVVKEMFVSMVVFVIEK